MNSGLQRNSIRGRCDPTDGIRSCYAHWTYVGKSNVNLMNVNLTNVNLKNASPSWKLLRSTSLPAHSASAGADGEVQDSASAESSDY